MSVERQVRTLVRAWPIPDRTERGDEIVGATLDLLPDGQSRLPVALALNLVVGGLRARWRMRPPLWRWFLYRMGGRLPIRWQRWMLNDLTGPGWRRRMIQGNFIVALISLSLTLIVVSGILLHPSPKLADSSYLYDLQLLGVIILGSTLSTAWRARKLRNRRLSQHFIDGSPRNDPPRASGPQAPNPSSC
jgi:hypothetical protein